MPTIHAQERPHPSGGSRLGKSVVLGLTALLLISVGTMRAQSLAQEGAPASKRITEESRQTVLSTDQLKKRAETLARQIAEAKGVERLAIAEESRVAELESEARSIYNEKKLDFESAIVKLKEYELGEYEQKHMEIESKIHYAERDLALQDEAKEEIQEIEKALNADKDMTEYYRTKARIELRHRKKAREAAVELANFKIEQAKTALKVLDKYDKPRRVKEFYLTIEQAKSNELGAKVKWESMTAERKKARADVKLRTLSSEANKAAHLLKEAIATLEKLEEPRAATNESERLRQEVQRKLTESERLWELDRWRQVTAEFKASL